MQDETTPGEAPQSQDPTPAPTATPAPPPRATKRAAAPPRNLLDLLLRRPDALSAVIARDGAPRVLSSLIALSVLGMAAYGLVVGSYSGGMQWWAVPAKLALGTTLLAAICYPSLYIVVCMQGAELRAGDVAALLFGTLALASIFLGGFAPICWVFSQSASLVGFVGLLHLIAWTVSFMVSLRLLRVGLAAFGARASALTFLWSVMLFVTSLQMMTVLRPLVGSGDVFRDGERMFFLQHWAESLVEEQY